MVVWLNNSKKWKDSSWQWRAIGWSVWTEWSWRRRTMHSKSGRKFSLISEQHSTRFSSDTWEVSSTEQVKFHLTLTFLHHRWRQNHRVADHGIDIDAAAWSYHYRRTNRDPHQASWGSHLRLSPTDLLQCSHHCAFVGDEVEALATTLCRVFNTLTRLKFTYEFAEFTRSIRAQLGLKCGFSDEITFTTFSPELWSRTLIFHDNVE